MLPLGWDYSGRWLKQPLAGNSSDQLSKLRTLNIRNTIPVDLNAILCACCAPSCPDENT